MADSSALPKCPHGNEAAITPFPGAVSIGTHGKCLCFVKASPRERAVRAWFALCVEVSDLQLCRIVVKHLPCSCPKGIDPQFDQVCANCNFEDEALGIARDVRAACGGGS